jgi:hypothetical protein
LGLGDPFVTRGIATADVDGDGDLDFAIANQWEESFFFRNDAPHPGQFLGLRLRDPSGAPLIGAVARVAAPDGSSQLAQVDGGNGHSGVRCSELHFGLGAVPDGMEVPVDLRWRDRLGAPHQAEVRVSPGWHNLELGEDSRVVTSEPSTRS